MSQQGQNTQTPATTPAATPTTTPKATDSKFAEFGKGWNTPFSKVDDKYNLAGALLVGGGSGLITWFLSRMFGLKSDVSLGASIIAGLAGAHGALSSQQGDGITSFKYLDDLFGKTPPPPPQPVEPVEPVEPPQPPVEPPQPAETPQERFQKNLIEQNQIDALHKLTKGKTPEKLQQLYENLDAIGKRPFSVLDADLYKSPDTSALDPLSKDERKSIMSGDTVSPEFLQRIEDEKNKELEIRSFGKPLNEMTDDDWLREKNNPLAKLIVNEFNGFKNAENEYVRNPDGSVNDEKVLSALEHSGNPRAMEAVKRYLQALSNRQSQIRSNEADVKMRKEIEESEDRRRYPEKYSTPEARQPYTSEYAPYFRPSIIVPNRGPSGYDYYREMSPHSGEDTDEIWSQPTPGFEEPIQDMSSPDVTGGTMSATHGGGGALNGISHNQPLPGMYNPPPKPVSRPVAPAPVPGLEPYQNLQSPGLIRQKPVSRPVRPPRVGTYPLNNESGIPETLDLIQ